MGTRHKQKEEWLPVVGYEGHYQVSNIGRVKSIKKGKELILAQANSNYPAVSLWKEGVLSIRKVHRLVAKAWIPNPENKPEVNHKDWDRANNTVDNLEWVTRKENVAHSIVNGLAPRGEDHKNSKLTAQEVREIKHSNDAQRSLAKKYGVSQSLISNIKNGFVWRSTQ